MIVIGGGIIGLSCAWRLAQRGLPVRLFDARELAAEASWAGAGMLAPGGEFSANSALARMAVDSLKLYSDFVDELRSASGMSIDYRQCGALEMAFSDSEAAELTERAAAQAAIGIRSEPAGMNRFYPDDAVVDPRDVTAALKVACERAEVEFHEHESVLDFLPDSKGIVTALGEYYADGVVLAAGAWSSELLPTLPKITPVRGHLIAYEPPAGFRLQSLVRHQHTYLLQRSSGIIVAGSSTEHVGFETAIDRGIVDAIHERACRLVPELASARILDFWNGFRPHIEGELPAIGRVPGTSIWAACGHYRNGILLAPLTAAMITSEIGTPA